MGGKLRTRIQVSNRCCLVEPKRREAGAQVDKDILEFNSWKTSSNGWLAGASGGERNDGNEMQSNQNNLLCS